MGNLLTRILKFKHRKHKRFQVREGLTVVLDRNASNGDQIIDIGMGGLTFNYVDEGEPLADRFEIDILIDGQLTIEAVKVKLVANIEVGDISFQGKSIRRISVQFLSLTPVQEFDLKAIIKSHTFE